MSAANNKDDATRNKNYYRILEHDEPTDDTEEPTNGKEYDKTFGVESKT